MGLIVDLFAGGGGGSTGLEWALGRSPDIAINHDPEALAMHRANHPCTRHLCANVLKVLPLQATGGAAVDWLHASPDCTHFSKAKGGKPRSQFIRDLAWVVIRWAEDTRPIGISLENVEEFQTWGPLDRAGQPIKAHAGSTFRAWVRRLRRLGYKVSWRELRACDFGAPTTRKRLFVMARRDGKPVVWPRPTHGDPKSEAVRSGKLLPWRTAAECIDWSLPTQSIFARKKPLADNTLRRIAEGIRRYVLESPAPFLVSYYGAKSEKDFRGSPLDTPLRTQTTENRFALVSPVMMVNTSGHAAADARAPLHTVTTGKHHYLAGCIVNPNHTTKDGSYAPFRGHGCESPLGTITQSPGFALASATMVQTGYGERMGQSPRCLNIDAPLGTVVAGGVKHALVTAGMVKMRGTNIGSPVDDPLHTVSAQGQHHALLTTSVCKHYGSSIGHPIDTSLSTITGKNKHSLLTGCLVKYYGQGVGSAVSDPIHTVTSKDRMGFVTAPLTHEVPQAHCTSRYLEVRTFLRARGVIAADAEADVVIDGEAYRITDICLRMLKPRELYRAQGFPDSYHIAPIHAGKPLTITAQVRMCGNSVPPQFVSALVQANGPNTWAAPRPPRKLPLLQWAGHMPAQSGARHCFAPV